MMKPSVYWIVLGLLIVIASACNLTSPEQPEETIEAEVTFTPTTEPSATSSPTLSASNTPLPQPDTPIIASSTPLPTSAPPTETLIPTATLGPYVHVIQADETLGFIIQIYGYPFDLNVIQEVVRINDNIVNADFLPPIGTEILIPRQTATPIPEGIEMTSTADAELGISRTSGAPLPTGTNIDCYEVQEGDSLIGIAIEYNTTLEILSEINPDINWFGCDFTQPSGGPNCSPSIQINQCIQVPQPTPVPTATPSPSGNETATPTPTYIAPRVVSPSNNSFIQRPNVTLQWVSAGVLKENETYLIEVLNTTSNIQWNQVTTQTSIQLPNSVKPNNGETHELQWRVTVAKPNDAGTFGPIGEQGRWRSFQWQSN